MSLSSIPTALRTLVWERDAGRCRYCRLQQIGQAAVFHVDHVLPRSQGGATTLGNLVLQCPYCSLHKSDKTTGFDAATGGNVELFHPLEQDWDRHFVLLEDATLAGQTPEGRATIEALHMNDAIPRTARAFQLMLGLI